MSLGMHITQVHPAISLHQAVWNWSLMWMVFLLLCAYGCAEKQRFIKEDTIKAHWSHSSIHSHLLFHHFLLRRMLELLRLKGSLCVDQFWSLGLLNFTRRLQQALHLLRFSCLRGKVVLINGASISQSRQLSSLKSKEKKETVLTVSCTCVYFKTQCFWLTKRENR